MATAKNDQLTAIGRLALPAAAALVVPALTGMVTMSMVGHTLGTPGLAALGTCGSLFALAFKVFNFLGSASTPAIARALHLDAACGLRNSTQAAAVAGRFVWLAILIGIAVGGLMLVSVDRLLGWMMVSQAQLSTTRRLARLRAVGAPLELVSMALRGLLSGCGDTSSQLRATIAECLTQTAISTILIKHLGWGVEAVGVGLLTSHVFSTVMLAKRLRRHVAVNLGLASLPAPALLWQCLVDCSPLVCRTFCLHGLLTLQSRTAASLSDAAIAAHSIARQASSVCSLFVDSLAIAGQSIVATMLAKGDVPAARRAVDALLLVGGGIGLVLALALAMTTGFVATMMTDDLLVLSQATEALQVVAMLQVPGSAAYVFDGVFIGANDFAFLAQAMAISAAGGALILTCLDTAGQHGLASAWLAGVGFMALRAVSLAARYWAPTGPFAVVAACSSRGSSLGVAARIGKVD